jgi:predicted AlkP superfamily pyrophosphatase or phosphodiesterase
MKKVVFVLMDAFRSDYLTHENTPFLFECSRKGTYYKEVEQSRSFCERSEIFTGLSPKKSGFFTAIGYDPLNSPFRKIKFLKALSFIESTLIPKNVIYRVYKRFINKRFKRIGNGMSTYSIPLYLLKYFNLTEDLVDFRSDKAFDNKDNIFKHCMRKGKNIFYDSFTALNFIKPMSDQKRLELVLNKFSENYSLYLIYQSKMDVLGHTYGPDSLELNTGLKKFDLELEAFYNQIPDKKNVSFIFLGDHGMTKVNKSIDVNSLIKSFSREHKLKLEKDFVYFLDSTMFRIWYLSEKAKDIFEKKFKKISIFDLNGIFVDDSYAEKESIPFGDKRYGDILWMANLGVLIFPDFFHTKKVNKGMHGYTTKDISSKGTCIVLNNQEPKTVDKILLTEVYNLLKNELDV